MSIFLIAMCAVFLATAATEEMPKQSMNGLSFMTGSWAMEHNGKRVEEHWTAPRGGMMLAMAVTLSEGKTVFFEFLRVEETHDGIFYQAQPRGQPATPFKLVTLAKEKAVFENPQHDFPTRVTYWREGENLCAKIEGKRNGREASEQWTFKPATLGKAD
jgi:hypothetical protein